MIQTRGLTKIFDHHSAVDGLDLSIAEGEKYALLGPLGCGNSSVIKMLATLVRPTRGEGLVAERDIRNDPEGVRQVVGYMPDIMGVYDDMKVAECLSLFSLGHGMDEAQAEARTAALLELTGLQGQAREFVETLDREHRQRLGLARALLHRPTVLLLDKPTAGLDLAARERMLALIARAREFDGAPCTLLLSSNLLSDATTLCMRVGVMLRGHLVAEGPVGEIARKLAPHRILEVELNDHAAAAATWLRTRPGIRHADAHGGYLIFTQSGVTSPAETVQAMRQAGYPVKAWREHEIDFDSLITPAE